MPADYPTQIYTVAFGSGESTVTLAVDVENDLHVEGQLGLGLGLG